MPNGDGRSDEWATPIEGPPPSSQPKRLRDMTVLEIVWYLLRTHGNKLGHVGGWSGLVLVLLQAVGGINTLLPEEQLKESATSAVEERLEGAEAMLVQYALDAATREKKVTDALTMVNGLEKRLSGTMKRVDAAIEQAHDAAARVDKKVDVEVGHVRESLSDKLAAVRAAFVALKDVSLEKMKYLDKSATATDAKMSVYERRLNELEDAVDDIEKYLGIGFTDRPVREEHP